MTIQELEQQLLNLEPAEKLRLIQRLSQSLAPQKSNASLVDFFRNSPLCKVADEIDLNRDRSPILDRVHL